MVSSPIFLTSRSLSVLSIGQCYKVFSFLGKPIIHILIYHFFSGLYCFSQLKHHKKLYESYVPMKYKSYIKQMKKLVISTDQLYFDFIREQSINCKTNLIFSCCLAIDQESGEIMLLYKQRQIV